MSSLMTRLKQTLTMFRSKPLTLVSLVGPQRSGKDTVADYLCGKYGFKKMAFADPVRAIAEDLFDMKSKDRDLLVSIGQKMREIDPDVFVNFLQRRLETTTHNRFVISDFRFKNEFEAFKDRSWTIKVFCPLPIRQTRPGFNPEYVDHETEIELKDVDTDYVIHNEFSLSYLYSQVDNIIESILEEEYK